MDENAKILEEIERALLDLGVPDALKGHKCLLHGLTLAVENPAITGQITKEFYPAVAELCDTTASSAERAIRHAIEVAWDRCDYETLTVYFGATVSPLKGRPTNREFVARIANVIRKRVYGGVRSVFQ